MGSSQSQTIFITGTRYKMSFAIKHIPKKEVSEALMKAYPDFRFYHIEALQAIFELSSDMEKAMEQYFVRHKFSRARFLILIVLLHNEAGRMTPNEIAKSLNVTRGNMTGLIDCLLEAGLVTKVQDQEDRRQVWIKITPKASKFLDGFLPDYFKRLAKFMSVLKREEVETLIQISRKLDGAVQVFSEE